MNTLNNTTRRPIEEDKKGSFKGSSFYLWQVSTPLNRKRRMSIAKGRGNETQILHMFCYCDNFTMITCMMLLSFRFVVIHIQEYKKAANVRVL